MWLGARFTGKAGPVHSFRGAMDLACIRFGRGPPAGAISLSGVQRVV
ncbi:DUF5996 family protein [Nocardia fusca]|uniref:DUF5996 family protein n=1 Tax=Nocardia fusca TaxID=941183 RepID=A0ABV3F407_9NOCA